jgi:hypothetical protein
MTPITDEQMLRSGLADLTNDQPPMPPARFQSVRRRAIRHRKRQLTGALVCALAVAGIVVGTGRVPGILHQPPVARHVPGWALPWPDYRNGSVPQSVLNNAVLAWGDPAKYVQGSVAPSPREAARLVASYHVVWYAGQTVARGQDVVVMFEANSPGALAADGSAATGPQLVVATASASGVMSGQPAWMGDTSPWALTTTPAPARPSSFGPDISEYIPELSASGTAIDNWDNWIVVLPAPGSRFSGWAATTNAGRTSITGLAPHGVFVADVGQVTADVALRFGSGPGDWVPVGLPGAPAVPSLASPQALVPPASFQMISSMTGQGTQPSAQDLSVTASGGPYAVLANCYNALPNGNGIGKPTPGGHGRLVIMINSHRVGSVLCDDKQHELTIPRSMLRPHGEMTAAASSSLTSWQISFGRVH